MKVKKKLASLPRKTMTTKADKNKSIDDKRMWRFSFERLEHSRKQTRDARKEVRELKKKVSSLNETIVWLLNK